MLKKHNKSKPRLICSLLLVNKLYNQVSAFYQNKAEKIYDEYCFFTKKYIIGENTIVNQCIKYFRSRFYETISRRELCKAGPVPQHGVKPSVYDLDKNICLGHVHTD